MPEHLDGVSLLPTLTHSVVEPNPLASRPIFFLRREGGMAYNGLTIQAVRRGDWKCVHNLPFNTMELYNLRDDPHETRNLAHENPGMRNELARLMMLQTQRGGAVPWQKPQMAFPPTDSDYSAPRRGER